MTLKKPMRFDSIKKDEYLIDLMERGLLRVELVTLDVYIRRPGHKCWSKRIPQVKPGSTRIRYAIGPKRLYYYRSRIVWMWVHRKVPPGIVDHKDRDNTNDHPHNLCIMGQQESDRQGFDIQQDKALQSCLDFFDEIAKGYDDT